MRCESRVLPLRVGSAHTAAAEREAKASLEAEREALAEKVRRLQGADHALLADKEELQAALIRSEEERLELAQELLDMEVRLGGVI